MKVLCFRAILCLGYHPSTGKMLYAITFIEGICDTTS